MSYFRVGVADALSLVPKCSLGSEGTTCQIATDRSSALPAWGNRLIKKDFHAKSLATAAMRHPKVSFLQ
jgi:hypothetical protein